MKNETDAERLRRQEQAGAYQRIQRRGSHEARRRARARRLTTPFY